MNPLGFRECVAATIGDLTLSESNWKSPGWQKLAEKVSQDDLNDAFNQHGIVRAIFADLGEITQRNCKSLVRVQKKLTEQAPGRENFFKVVSDFVAVRVPCEVVEIPGKIDCLRRALLKNGNNGLMHVRGSSDERPYGFCFSSDKKFTDITQYVYVFLDKVGYPIEFQIGHPFAAHTFSIDSALRDDPTCGKIDLWKDNFYSDVKKRILDKANDEAASTSMPVLLAKADELHHGNIPKELSDILAIV
jgi:hypothetical protein